MTTVAPATGATAGSTAVSADAFRQAMSHVAHSVSIVTTGAPGSAPRGLTCSALMSVSAEPPIVAVAIHRLSSVLPVLREHRAFCVNVLDQESRDLALLFATRAADRFTDVPWSRTTWSGSPVLDVGCLARFECEVVDAVDSGDHAVIFGLVRDTTRTHPGATPLIHCRRTFGSWRPADTEERPDES